MASGSGYSDENVNDFKNFLEGWMVRQEHYLDELLSAQQNCSESHPDPDDLKEVIQRVLAHYQQYYQHKSIASQRNVFLVFSPDWFTPLEKSLLWIAGFKPGLAFKLVLNAVPDLSEDQRRGVNRLADETRAEERVLMDDLAKIQESVAAPPLLAQARVSGRVLVDGEVYAVEAAIVKLKSALELVVSNADLLRMSTASKVVELLNPVQGVRFLTAATQLHLRIRSMGHSGRDESGK